MEQYTFKFKGKQYQLTNKWEETCINDSKDFQMQQYDYLLQIKDYVTLENRIINQEKFGYLKQI